MDEPEASSHSGPDEALRRKSEAVVSGLAVDIGGFSTWLQASDSRRADAVAHLLAEAGECSSPTTLSIRFESGLLAPPPRPPDVEMEGMELWLEEEELVARDGSGLMARADERTLTVRGDSDNLRTPFRRLFHVGISYMLAHRDRFLIHGGAILTPDEQAILVLGGSGSGKSTLVAAALQGAWSALSDDMIVVRPGRASSLVMGIPRPIAVPPDVAHHFRIHPSAVSDARLRVELPPGHLRSGWGPVAGVVTVAHGFDDGGGLRTLEAKEVFATLLASFIPSHKPPLLRRFYAHAAVLSRLPSWELLHDPDPGRRVHSAVKRLDSVRLLLDDPE